MRHAVALAVALALLLPAVADGKPHLLVGKWKGVGPEVAGKPKPMPDGLEVSIEFKDGGAFAGTVKEKGKSRREEGTWKAEGDKLTMVSDGKSKTFVFRIQGKVLRLVAEDDQVLVWERVAE